jgi:cytochrome P450
MSVAQPTERPEADLGSLEFWGRPARERDLYFEALRRDAPLSRHEPLEDILGLPDQGRPHYWAIVRYEDIRRISRDPATFCSGQGVQFGDAPQEMLEASQSFLAMDAPRHAKLRGLVSAADPEVFGDRQPIEVLGAALWTLTEFATELATYREQHPGDDLMTAPVQAEVDGDRLTHPEIAAFLVLLSVAGNDTTRHTASHALDALTQNPDQRALLMDDLDGRLPDAVEEFVRWASPVMTFRRTTTRDVELHGETLPPGEKVVLFYHSGNRDERAFENPWRFDITRNPNRHLGFGGGGPHYCMGASLARTQLKAIFAEMLRVVPDIEAGEPELLRSAFIHGVKRMPCTFAARA